MNTTETTTPIRDYTRELLDLMEKRARLRLLKSNVDNRLGREKRYTDKVKFLEQDSVRLEQEITRLSALIRDIEPHCKPVNWQWWKRVMA